MLHRLRELQDKDAETKREIKRPSPRKTLSGPLLPLDEETLDGGFDKSFPLGQNGADTEGREPEEDVEMNPSASEPEKELPFHPNAPHKANSCAPSAVKTMMKPMSAPGSLAHLGASDASGYPKRKASEKESGRSAKHKLTFSLPEPERNVSELSNSSWSEMSPWVIGNSYRLYPLTPEIEQRLILQYLTPLGEYQEVGCSFFFFFFSTDNSLMSMFAFSTAPFVDLVNFFPKSVIVSSPPLSSPFSSWQCSCKWEPGSC